MRKPKQLGTIRTGPLAGKQCEVVKRNASGKVNVRLLEGAGAYKAGDVVTLGTGEFARAGAGR